MLESIYIPPSSGGNVGKNQIAIGGGSGLISSDQFEYNGTSLRLSDGHGQRMFSSNGGSRRTVIGGIMVVTATPDEPRTTSNPGNLGVDDLSNQTSGYTGTAPYILYTITISDDTPGLEAFTWNDGGDESDPILIGAGVPVTLSNGVIVQFAGDSGHSVGDSWTFQYDILYQNMVVFDGLNDTITLFGANGDVWLDTSSLTTSRRLQLPDQDGQIALVGTVPPLSSVLTAGNIIPYNQVIIQRDSFGNTVSGIQILNAGDGTFYTSNTSGSRVVMITKGDTLRFAASGTAMDITAPSITAPRAISFPDKSGTIALTKVGNSSILGFSGFNYSIAHGMSTTPTFANIVAKNPDTAIQIQGGYYLDYDATNINITFLTTVPAIPGISLDLDWQAQ